MNPKIGYAIVKLLSKLRREKNKETINRWFIKQGVNLAGGYRYTYKLQYSS